MCEGNGQAVGAMLDAVYADGMVWRPRKRRGLRRRLLERVKATAVNAAPPTTASDDIPTVRHHAPVGHPKVPAKL